MVYGTVLTVQLLAVLSVDQRPMEIECWPTYALMGSIISLSRAERSVAVVYAVSRHGTSAASVTPVGDDSPRSELQQNWISIVIHLHN